MCCPLNSKLHPVVTTTTALIATADYLHHYCHCPSLRNFITTSKHHKQPQKNQQRHKSFLDVSGATSETELWAAACLRVRTFCDFQDQAFGTQDHERYLAEHEYEALKERIAGTRLGFKRVSCINATLPWSQVATISDDLCNSCKRIQVFYVVVVVGTLDLNQCISLPDEITGMKPKGIEADFARACLGNVCVAKELQRNGLGYDVVCVNTINY